MMEEEKIKEYVDGAEKELRELFADLIYEHGDNGGRTEGSLTVGSNPMQFSLGGLDKCVTAGDGGIYYVGDLFDKGNGKGNGKQ